MFISQLEMAEVSVIIPTLSWVAEQAGMVLKLTWGVSGTDFFLRKRVAQYWGATIFSSLII